MRRFETALLREKFGINNSNSELIVVANRIECPLVSSRESDIETLTIRGKNLYNCVRFLSKILQAHFLNSNIIKQSKRSTWDIMWTSCMSDYDKNYNNDQWIALYHQGKCIFEKGKRHAFLNMIEKFHHENPNKPYEDILKIAEEAFQKTGKNFKTSHDFNVAMVIDASDKSVRCGTIQRRANKQATFSFTSTLEDNDLDKTGFTPFISAAAAHSEATQLCFTIAHLANLKDQGKVQKGSKERKQLTSAQNRLKTLDNEISDIERSYKTVYRPERPNFIEMIEEAR